MARLSYSIQALADLERISDFLADEGSGAQFEALELIEEAVNVLARHPFIGRPAEAGLHELLISQGRTAYVALYHYEAQQDVVLLLALRHQREAGYQG